MNINEISIENDFLIIISNNNSVKNETLKKDISSSFIQFHFVHKGKVDFLFNRGNYKLSISENRNLMLYNPTKDLPLDADIFDNSVLISILITIKKFHQLFSNDSENISFLSPENSDQKYYNEKSTLMSVTKSLTQVFEQSHLNVSNKLFLKSKVYEIFSLKFMKDENNDEQCPFIMSDDQIKKIKRSKEIIVENFSNPPNLSQLSEEVGLSLRNLKEGFKEVYGKPVFQYLLDYKLDLSKKMLDEGKYNVNEVSLHLGYSTASHFITAFKKKYSMTPKQYSSNNF